MAKQARKLGGHKSKKDAVTAALSQYVRTRRSRGIVDLAGKIEYFDDYDYKAARADCALTAGNCRTFVAGQQRE